MEIIKTNDRYYSDLNQSILDNPNAKSSQTINVQEIEGVIVCVNDNHEFFLRDDNWKYDKQIKVFVEVDNGENEMMIDISHGTEFEISESGYYSTIDGVVISSLSLTDELKRDINNEIENYIHRSNQQNNF